MTVKAKLVTNYEDRRLTLRGHKVSYYEPGRELGALVPLVFSNPSSVSWQIRSMVAKVLSLLSVRKGKKTSVAILDPSLHFVCDFISLAFSERVGGDIFVLTHQNVAVSKYYQPSAFTKDRVLMAKAGIREVNTNQRIDELLDKVGLNIVLIGSEHYDHFISLIQIVEIGLLNLCVLIKDQSYTESKYPSIQMREYGLRLSDTADGFSELWGFQA
jgi:hypothetical protein